MIAVASGARVVAVDIAPGNLGLAREFGAEVVINAAEQNDLPEAVIVATEGGAHLSIDALGSSQTCQDAIRSLRRQGRHVQIGLMVGADAAPAIPMGRVISHELEVVGSHGMAAHRFESVFGMMTRGLLQPGKLIQRRIPLAASIEALVGMDRFASPGVTIISAEG